MGLSRNITANAVGRFGALLATYCFPPIYLHLLGTESYGLVGFYATLLAICGLADMGLAVTLNRQLARLAAQGDMRASADSLRTYEVIYLGTTAVIAGALLVIAPWVAKSWLDAGSVPLTDVTQALRFMAVAIAIQLLAGLYFGGLMGLQLQARANSLQVAWFALQGFGAIVAMQLASATITVFAAWQVAANFAYCVALRYSLTRVLQTDVTGSTATFRWSIIRDSRHNVAGMAAITLVFALLTQIDKLAISATSTLSLFGYYTLAGVLASVPVVIAGPIGAAVFPRFSSLASVNARADLAALYRLASELVAAAAIPVGLLIAAFSQLMLVAWTGSLDAALHADVPVTLLAIGQVIQAVTLVSYYFVLAHGDVRTTLMTGLASMAIVAMLLWVLIPRWGLTGAALSWLLMSAVTLPFYVHVLLSKFLPGEFRQWIVYSFARPVVLASAPIGLAWLLTQGPDWNRPTLLLVAAMAWLVSVLLIVAASPLLRAHATRTFRSLTGKKT